MLRFVIGTLDSSPLPFEGERMLATNQKPVWDTYNL